jgi:hypothetical protein
METDKAAAVRFEIKDLMVMIPLLGSGLAITYEIGSFYPLGSSAFGLFSLSEHLLWALAAFPIVLILLGSGVMTYWLYSIEKFRGSLRKRRPDEGRRRKRNNKLTFIAFVAGGVICLWLGWKDRSAFFIALGMLAFGAASTTFLPSGRRTRPYALMLMVAFAFMIAGAVGFDQTRNKLLSRCAAEFAFKDGIKSAVLVRSGERGALLYDPVRNRFTFDKWEDLKSIDWPYLSPAQQFSIFPVPIEIKRARSACNSTPSS